MSPFTEGPPEAPARHTGAGLDRARPTERFDRSDRHRDAASWVVVAVAVVASATGIVVGEPLLLAAGLVLAASTGRLFQPPASRPRRRRPTRRPWWSRP